MKYKTSLKNSNASDEGKILHLVSLGNISWRVVVGAYVRFLLNKLIKNFSTEMLVRRLRILDDFWGRWKTISV